MCQTTSPRVTEVYKKITRPCNLPKNYKPLRGWMNDLSDPREKFKVQRMLLHVVFCGSMDICLDTFGWPWRCKVIGERKLCYFTEFFCEVVLYSFAQIWPDQQEIMDKPSGAVYSYKRNKLLMQVMSFVQESIHKNAGDLQWILILHQDFFDLFTQFLTEH